MENRKTYGQYIVGQGKDFKVKLDKTHNIYDKALTPDAWYVVHITGQILGVYPDEALATILAKGLSQRDQMELTEEMDKVLRGQEE